MKKLLPILTLIISLSTITGGVFYVDARFAKDLEIKSKIQETCNDFTTRIQGVNNDIKLVELRLEQKIENDRIDSLQERMWRYEKEYGTTKAQEMEEYKRLKVERDMKIKNQENQPSLLK